MNNETQDFNADAFLDAVHQDQVESKFTPVPADEYPAYIKQGSVVIEPVNFKDGNTGKRFTCQWVIDDAALAEKLGMTSPQVRQQFILDLTDSGALAAGKNKNVRIGKIVEAGGLPNPGWSFRQFDGLRARIKVTHRPDKNDAEIVYAEVSAVTRLA